MTTKLLNFFDAVPMSAPLGSCLGAFPRLRTKASPSPARGGHYVPRLRTPIACKWQVDPLSGELIAIWSDSSEAEISDVPRRLSRLCRTARGRASPSYAAARQAA